MKWLLVLGASSDIARATALYFAKQGWNLLLAGRKLGELEKDAADLRLRTGQQALALHLDALDGSSHQSFFEDLPHSPNGVLCAIGYLGQQDLAESDPREARCIMDTNYTASAELLMIAANKLRQQGHGFIVGISSVAGDRGRQSNYTYGSAKAAFSAWLSGLRNRLHPHGIQVLTVKPGFVRTDMTEGMDLPKLLTATPEQVATDIYKAVKKKKNVIYTRWFWRWIMLIIRCIPEFVFKKLKL